MRNLFQVATISSGLLLCQAFLSTTYSTTAHRGVGVVGNPGYRISTVIHAAKQRRRRRRDPNEADESKSTASGNSSGELPDFELNDEEEAEAKALAKKKAMKISSNPDEITPAMMGSSNSPVGSIRDLLSDRSLESKLEFDDEEMDDSLPDLIALSRSAQQGAPTGKKKARQAERRAAALAGKEAEEENIFANVPFIIDEEGKLSPVKVRFCRVANWPMLSDLFCWNTH